MWSLPGYDVEAMIGFGATGEVWRAREVATGDTVALKRLREGADPTALETLRREATLLRTLVSPHVVRLRGVIGDVLVLDHAPGGSLAALLHRRGCLDAGEVVTIGVAIASALVEAHALGLVHGDVTPANVLFTEQGMPLLADLGVARVAGEVRTGVDGTAEYVDPAVAAGGEPDAAADVWALAAVCHHLLAGTPPHDGDSPDEVLSAAVEGVRVPLAILAGTAPVELVAAIEAGLAQDPQDRPSAMQLRSLLRRAHATAPVQLAAGPAGPSASARETHVVRPLDPVHGGRRRRRLPRQAAPVVALVVLVVVTAGVGWVTGRGQLPSAAAVAAIVPVVAPSPISSPSRALPSSPAGPDWPVVLETLDDARARAFEAADPTLLEGVWSAGSPGLQADIAAARSLALAGRSAHGLRHEVRDVRVEQLTATSARLQVVDVLAAYEVR
ncbi:MAG: serine/threonine protein kinase, partial [Frankiales bacterium]|nr:serine/threonine protein kinase [Frankiales bacterium]